MASYDVRYYWGLSKEKKRHLIAFWSWGTFLIDGNVPYLALPSIGWDTYKGMNKSATADQPYTTARIATLCIDVPCVVWDAVRGPYGVNELGTTVLMATHNAEVVTALRKRVVALESGRVVRDEVGGYHRDYA